MKPTPKIDIAKFNEYVGKKLISRQEHPAGGLYVWNYTPIAQFSRTWDEITLQARGLITDTEGNIVARPFSKFFNYEEHTEKLPDESFAVHEKMDGSLGILYTEPGGSPALATRGSFISDQAIMGTRMLRKFLSEHLNFMFIEGYTYLFEIIYPENRIVVNYGNAQRLVLLAVINTKTGAEKSIAHIDYPDKANEWYNATNLEQLRGTSRENSEGYVIRFESGLRLKMKHAEYVRLHRILTNVSSKNIWEQLKAGEPLDEILERVPDEFYKWVKDTQTTLTRQHDMLLENGKAIANEMQGLERKEVAMRLQKVEQPYPAIVFALLDGKDSQATDIAWKFIRPKYEKPFKEDIDS